MAKAKTEVDYENYRIEVVPELVGLTHESQIAALTGIKKAIERHVDNAQAAIGFDTIERCAYCHERTDLGYVDGNPLCCDEAINEVADGHKGNL
ncbi:hypothetical protein KITKAT_86 [Arthrobacter phage Kitkat]|uniref:Uncharacterized protein n=2 Tax=Kelleziovirus kitkat TaxID=1982238 RepID=A0A140G6R2_9CAUD|nr:hypothetical protein BJD77_gp086 [Arthrobacter phage Kitkat]AMM44347.1 hypothetical protein KITKAT_86 [Arthrobacter phage Kitkat]QGJ96524.1 hypothetical protein SEA_BEATUSCOMEDENTI_85 [Arthrobacter phage BeatusComedenti]